VPWEGRYARFDEQIQVCKLLWSEAPANYSGTTVQLERIHQWPRPVQAHLPIWLGLAPTPRNIERIAEYGDGWIRWSNAPRSSRTHRGDARGVRQAQAGPGGARGARGAAHGVRRERSRGFRHDCSRGAALLKAGATMFEFLPAMYCRGPEEFDAFCSKLSRPQVGRCAMTDPALRRMLDEHALRRLAESYARAVDRLDPELLVSLFTPTASLRPISSSPDQLLTLVAPVMPERHAHRGPRSDSRHSPRCCGQRFKGTWHCVMNQTTTIDGDAAHGESLHARVPPVRA
jgi:alkanesulfonate monooxygenase SsuD/methylene tetrahydromethanopterin reductase-like flavin-dependent oxidoreductase (luciferase family)